MSDEARVEYETHTNERHPILTDRVHKNRMPFSLGSVLWD